ncbi:V-set and immunoglobulin domain-containing protein 10 isoform X1 [Podarcis raffonei]|uniref:V-set and immunoglobulin domain-containing protein 10 isoform X1 n=1 Tax=Podarcis raffonei TaxID=65483 RepID=UPI00232905E7|nr:V-set and immunoglobulin domain-containing protein 10 isoform X1 [Podarcis raffonei]
MACGLAARLLSSFSLLLCLGRGIAAGTEEVVIGEVEGNVTLVCRNVSPRAVKVEWFHGDPGKIPILFSSDGSLPSDARFSLVRNSSFHISGLRLQDEGNYTCREVLNETDHRHRIQLLVASGPTKVNVNIGPATALPNGTLYAQRHGTLNFSCTSDSRPTSATKWDFSQSGSGQEPFTEVNSSLSYFTLYNLSPSLQGNYSCSATNLLSHRQQTVTRELLIYYPPPSLPRCWAQTSAEGSGGVQLHCSWTGGYPHPTLQWTNLGNLSRDSNVTDIADTNVAALNGSPLLSGKEFVCRGIHLLQQTSQACTVKLEAPSLVSDPMRSCFVGGATRMTCQASAGNPPANISWLRNVSRTQTEIRSGGRFLVSQKGNVSTLVIQNCSHGADSGLYICKVENPLGLKEAYVYLTVIEPVNIAGIVGAIVVLLLLGVLVLSGVLLYAGPRWCPKANMLRNRDASDILVLMDSEEEDPLSEAAGEPTSDQGVALANGGSATPHQSPQADVPSESSLEDTNSETRSKM